MQQETDSELLDKYDFNYVKTCNKPNELRRAIKLLEKEPFPDLLEACKARLKAIDPT